MKTITCASIFTCFWLALMLSACDDSAGPSASILTSQVPTDISTTCNTVVKGNPDPGLACFDNEPKQFTGIDFGDSVSLGWTVNARHDLCGVMDFRHDNWERGDIDLCGVAWNPYDAGQQVAASDNNGFSSTELDAMEKHLADPTTHYNVCTFNSGYHDMQRTPKHPSVNIPLNLYSNNLEAEAQIMEQHCDIIIWVDSTPMPGNRGYAGDTYVLTADIPAYNAVGRAVARRHGFYILNWDGDPQHDPRANENVHFTQAGYAVLGQQVVDCIYTAVNQESSTFCHQ